MFQYAVRRIAYMVPILFGIALITFILFNVVGGDPVLVMLGKHANPQSIAEMRAQLGLDQPLPVQFVQFLKQIVTFDFGRSYSTKQEISTMIIGAAPVSFSFAFPAFIIALSISISCSLLVAFYRGRWVDKLFILAGVIGISVPSLAYILFGQYFLAYKMGWFPISGYSGEFPEIISYISLPVIIWIALSIGGELRFYRTVMLDEVNQDYIRTARAKGLSETKVMFKHVLKNAMIPIITSVIIEVPFLITGSLLIENFFGIPGLGSQLVDAFNTSDIPLIKAEVVIFSILYMVFGLLTDLMYGVVDPRVSLK
jgi:peptide/nickel transport system permease protein